MEIAYNLNIRVRGMVRVRNHRLAQSILDAGWLKFFQMLGYKAEIAGVQVVKMNPRGRSKEYKYGRI